MKHRPQPTCCFSTSARSSLLVLCLGVTLTVAAHAAASDTADLAARLQPWGLPLIQSTVADDCLRVTFENQHGYEPMLAIGLVLSLVSDQAPAGGYVEAVALAEGKPLLQLRTSATQVEASLKQSLSRRQFAQLRQLLAGTPEAALAATPPTVAPTPTLLAAPPTKNGDVTGTPPTEQKVGAEAIANALVALGLENVQAAWLHNGDLNLQFENRTFRSEVRALGAVMATVSEKVAAATTVRIKTLRDEALLGVFTFRAGDFRKFQSGEITPAAMTEALRADRDTWDFSWPEATRESTVQLNPSRGRVDLLWRPGLEYAIGLERDPFESTPVLRPELVSTVGQGLRASLRGRVVLEQSFGASLDRALLTKFSGGTNPNLLWTASVGKFRHGAYGGFFEGQWTGASDSTRLGTRLAVLGESLGEDELQMYAGYLEHEFGPLGLTARATLGRFLYNNDTGSLLELERRFGESSMRLGLNFGMGQQQARMALAVPFGPGAVTKAKDFRVRPAPAIGLTYQTTTLPVADDLAEAPDLREFRGELTLPYTRNHPERLAGLAAAASPAQRWWTAPSFEGPTGLIRTPTADVIPDSNFALGYSWLPKDQTTGLHEGRSNSRPAFANIGFLPNLELSFRLTFYPDVHSFFDGHDVPWPYDLDRSFSAQYRLFEQERGHPALAIGSQDIAFGDDSSKVGRATYLVASHSWDDVRLHLGGGDGRFNGLFGGLEARLSQGVRLLAEYDADRVNVGLRLHSNKGFTVDGAWLDGKDFGAAVSYEGKLP